MKNMHMTVWPLFAILFLLTQSAVAAQRLEPPLAQLLANPSRARIVIAAVKEKTQPGRITFAVSQKLSGESPDEVMLRSDAQTYADAMVGCNYVVAWTYLRRNRGVIGGWEKDPDGPSIVPVLGLGSAAMFEDTRQIRLLFSPAADTQTDTAAGQLDALLVQMQRRDSRSRGLVIMELYLRPDLTDIMTSSQADVLKTVVQKEDIDPQHHDFLLRAALRLPPELTSPWLAEDFRRIILQNGSQYDLSSFIPGLVRTAARGLQQTGEPADLELLGALLDSNNPGVAKAALAAMDDVDPAATAAKAQQAMEHDGLHSETRIALSKYLGRAALRDTNNPSGVP